MLRIERRQVREVPLTKIAGCIGDPVLRLRFLRAAAPRKSEKRMRRWLLWGAILLITVAPFLMKLAAGKPETHIVPVAPPHAVIAAEHIAPVWKVEDTGDSEVYSNGLRIDTRYVAHTIARRYTAFQRDGANRVRRVPQFQPAGIVYHISESCQAPFDAQNTPVLKRLGESLLEYVRREHAYHYVIDRFGRVYRVVAESDIAYHAGHSVWADDRSFYVNLNESFLAISFEAETRPGQSEGFVAPGQIRAASMLTEMLRNRYAIPAANCVTHAQVSVNPSNMLVGYHTDWAAGFPFAQLGLPDNYEQALPAVWAFGFECDPAWLALGGRPISTGAEIARESLLRRAADAGLRPAEYRKALRQQYRGWLAEVRRTK